MSQPYISSTQVAASVPFDNATNGFLATDVQAAIEESANYLTVVQVTATAADTTSSTTDAVINTMTTTPAAGTYLVLFNGDMNSNSAGAAISASLYLATTQQATTLRKIIPLDGGLGSAGAARGIMQLQGLVTVNGSQAITAQWSISSGTASIAARSLITIRVA